VDLWRDEFSDDIVERAVEVQLAGRTCRMIEMHDLIAMKRRAGWIQDDYDVSEVGRHNVIDESRLRTLVSPELFAHFQSIKSRT
jgi:predicted nucleotidyltransferase